MGYLISKGSKNSIAKWIVDKHNGHFEIVSRKEIGTRIRIVFTT